MKNTIGLVEFNSIARGLEAADSMIKSAKVQLLSATAICPGKYIVLVGGDLSAVTNAVEHIRENSSFHLIDSFIIGNVSRQIFPALAATTDIVKKQALGIIETFTVASAIEAADQAVKSAVVELVEIRLARGMGGKCFVLMTGSVADVTASVEAGAKYACEQGLLVDKVIIANPHEDLWEKII